MIYPIDLDSKLAQFEISLNTLDSIPLVSTVSGLVRLCAGVVQVAVGTAFALLRVLFSILDGKKKTLQSIKPWLTLLTHGRLNMIRGTVALFPIIGNMILYTYDTRFGRMDYPREPKDLNRFQILRHLRFSGLTV